MTVKRSKTTPSRTRTMKHHPDHSRLIQAWLHVLNMRCCPPDVLLTGPSSPELEHHLHACPVCRRRLDLLRSFPPESPSPALDASSAPRLPTPGQLWSINLTLAGWGPKVRYYMPPVVLVTDVANDGTISVVQTCGEKLLAGSDDILLDSGFAGFAQPWNRYALDRNQLNFHLGTVSLNCVNRILAALTADEPNLNPGSLLWFFRQMEVETGFYFASQAQAMLTTMTEQDGPALLPIRPEQLARLPLVLPPGTANLPIEELLARTMPDESLLPLAAASNKDGPVQLLVFSIGNNDQSLPTVRVPGGILDPPQLETTAMPDGSRTTLLSVSGSCTEPIEPEAIWLFRWQCEEQCIAPLPGMSGAEQGVFWAGFPVDELTNPLAGTLLVRIIEQ